MGVETAAVALVEATVEVGPVVVAWAVADREAAAQVEDA